MNAVVVAALLAGLAFTAAGPRLARLLPPAAAVRLLVPASVLAGGCTVFVLGTVTFTWLGQLAQIARFGTWSPQRLHALSPVPPAAAVVATALLVAASGWAVWTALRQAHALLSVHRACRHLAAHADSPLVVIDSDDPDAFTTPGLFARIVVTTGMLAMLDAGGRAALLAHEQSHRRHRHTWWTLAADLAAAINPLLRPTAAAVRQATERWADEDAARTTNRRLVARTIAQVALLRAEHRAPSTVAAATGGQIPRRVQALLDPAPRIRLRHVGAVVGLSAAVLATALAVQRSGETLFEHAAKPPATATATATARGEAPPR